MKQSVFNQQVARKSGGFVQTVCWLTILCCTLVSQLLAQQFAIDSGIFSSGGGTSSSDQFSVTGTLDQPAVVESMTGGTFSLEPGFWNTVNPPTPVISSPSTATAVVGQTFSYTIVANNTPTSYAATGLPSALAIDITSGVISGTPTDAGTSTVTLSAVNAGGTGTKTLTLIVNPPTPVISSPSTATAVVGQTFSYTIVGNNTPTSYAATGLPSGLAINTTSGVISGTPTATGSSTVTLSAVNAGGTGTKTLTLTVNPPTPVISSLSTAAAVVGQTFSYTIVANNTPTSYAATGLPSGLAIDITSGVISGTPTVAGTSTVTLSAVNAGGTGTQTLTVTVNPPTPVITSLATATAVAGESFSHQITAENSPTSFDATGLPPGLTLDTANGVISGIPTTVGIYTVTLSANNVTGTGTQALTVTVNRPTPVITSLAAVTVIQGETFSYTITAENSPETFAAAGLPSGLSLDPATGLITGTPTDVGIANVTLSASNVTGTGSQAFTLTVNPPTPVITSLATATAVAGENFSHQITAENAPETFGATDLPIGLTLDSATGLISGTPTAVGVANVTLSASNVTGTGTKSLTVTVNPPKPVITSLATATAVVGESFSHQLAADNSPTSFEATGLPPGLTLDTATGEITGTPTTEGTASITLSAINITGRASQTLTLTVNPATPLITSVAIANATVGQTFNYKITADNSPATFEAMGLPIGLSLDSFTGIISGTPTILGVASVTLSAINVTGAGTRTLTLTVNPPIPAITSPSVAATGVGHSFSHAITASHSPTSFAATDLPSGLVLDTLTGLISGSPTTGGSYTITITASNAGGTGIQTLTLQVFMLAPSITSPTIATAVAGQVFTYTIAASNPFAFFGATDLPVGLTVDTVTGLISGIPTSQGDYTVTLSASIGDGATSNQTLVLTVHPPSPVFSSISSVAAVLGQPFYFRIEAENSPTSVAALDLPHGLLLESIDGWFWVITGIPTSEGTHVFTLSASNAGGSGTQTFTLTVDPFSYTSDGETITITGGNPQGTGDLVIPARYKGLPVTSIGDFAFADSPELRTISIPSSVTMIGHNAFRYCTGLRSITIPDNVTSIGDAAFEGCSGLTSVTIGNAVTSIGDAAFRDCTGLTNVTIPNSVTSIGSWAFADCVGLTTLTIGNSLTTIGYAAFAYCSGLTTVAIPDSVTLMSSGAFAGCVRLASFSVGPINSAFSSRDGVLFNKNETSLVSFPSATGAFTIPVGVTSIADGAFDSCADLTSVIIGNDVISIGNEAFWGCSGLTNVTIPNSVTSIGRGAFAACADLTSITIPANLTTIADWTFAYCPRLTNVAIPDSVISIGIEAFSDCSGLTTVKMGTSITVIGDYAFWNCPGLHIVDFTGNAPSPGVNVFTDSPNVKIYYALGTTGWGTTFADRPTVPSLAAPTITSPSIATATVGQPFSYTIVANDPQASFAASGVPSGLTLDSVTGIISGTPTTHGTYTVTLSAINAAGTSNQTLTLTINPTAPVITSLATATATVLQTFSYTITAENSPTSYAVSENRFGGLLGPIVNPANGHTYYVLPQGTWQNAENQAIAMGGHLVTVNDPAEQDWIISAFFIAAGAANESIWIGLKDDATEGDWRWVNGEPVNFTNWGSGEPNDNGGEDFVHMNQAAVGWNDLNGEAELFAVVEVEHLPNSLPPGLSLDRLSGEISGTPATAGVYMFTISASNAGGTGTQTLSLTVNPAMPVITSGLIATATVGQTFSYTITAENSPASFETSILPPGLSLNPATGTITGTPTDVGIAIITLSAINVTGTGIQTLELTVNPATPVITSAASVTVTVGQPFTYAITADNSPTSFAVSDLPSGLTFDPLTRVISGIPSTIGTHRIILSASNAAGTTTQTLTLAVNVKFLYRSDGTAITITGTEPKATGELIIPATIDGLPVTAIGFGAFWGCNQITSVTIPGSVISINDWAFRDCTGLTSVTIPNSIDSIGVYAFEGCIGLTTVPETPAVEKTLATMTLSGLKPAYTGSARLPSVQTVPSGLDVKFAYNGSPDLPTNAGTYTVVGLIQDANFEGRATNTLVVGKATAILAFADMIQTYDTTPKLANVSTTPPNLPLNVTYNGSSVPPVNAGTYTVVVSVSDKNYKGGGVSSLIITKGIASVDLVNLQHKFDGTPKQVEGITTPANLPVTLIYAGSTSAPINAGSYDVEGSVNTANWVGSSVSKILVISKAEVPITFANLAQTYDGDSKTVNISTTPGLLPVIVTYNGSPDAPINAGTYTVVATVDDPNHAGSATDTLTIAKRIAVVNFTGLTQAYSGSPRRVKATGVPSHVSVAVTYNGVPTAPIAPGTYTVVGVVEDANYTGTRTSTLSITAVPIFITRQPANTVAQLGKPIGLSVTHGGSPPWTYQWIKDGAILTGQTNRTLSFDNVGFSEVGTYNVVVSNPLGTLLSRPSRLSIATSTLHAWGYNSHGQSGLNIPENGIFPHSVTTNVVAAASGATHSLALRGDGRLFALGNNAEGQLGAGTITSSLTPVVVASNVVAIAAGHSHSHFVKSDGTLWSMGLNSGGQLGNGSFESANRPVAVASNVVAVAAGQHHSLFIKADATLWSMGSNADGQLGRATLTSTNRPILIASNVVSVAAGQYHSAFIKADRTLWSMGLNSSGQLGNGTIEGSARPVLAATDVLSVAAGEAHTIFVKADRSLWVVGANAFGQLGNGLFVNTSTPSSVASNVRNVSAGLHHSMFIQMDGSVWGMGKNDAGQLGTAPTGPAANPVRVSGLDWVGATVGRGPSSDHNLAIFGNLLDLPPNPPTNPPLLPASKDYFGAEETQLESNEIESSEQNSVSSRSLVLRVTSEAGLILVTSTSAAAGFTLEYASSLEPNAVWSPVQGISNPLVGATEIRIAPNQNAAFFRLRKGQSGQGTGDSTEQPHPEPNPEF